MQTLEALKRDTRARAGEWRRNAACARNRSAPPATNLQRLPARLPIRAAARVCNGQSAGHGAGARSKLG